MAATAGWATAGELAGDRNGKGDGDGGWRHPAEVATAMEQHLISSISTDEREGGRGAHAMEEPLAVKVAPVAATWAARATI